MLSEAVLKCYFIPNILFSLVSLRIFTFKRPNGCQYNLGVQINELIDFFVITVGCCMNTAISVVVRFCFIQVKLVIGRSSEAGTGSVHCGHYCRYESLLSFFQKSA